MTINQLLQKLEATSPILQANFGIERESLRVDRQGQLAHTPHPSCLGARSFHPYIQTDFCEFQMELITPVAKSTTEARRLLGAITDVAGRSIATDEILWPLSMPPRLKAEEVQVAQLENDFERHYRNYLAEKYGTKLQAISGIHYNMELGKDLVEALFQESDQTDMVVFKNALYLKLAQNYLRYRWVITYLFGAAPIAEQGFFDQEAPEPVRSFRNSDHGYVNKEEIQVSFASLEDYVSAIETYIKQGDLIAEKEFYSAVRFRGQKVNRSFLDKGITYLEFRNFDLNPFERIGISQDTMNTVHLLLLAFLWLDAPENVDQALAQGHALNEKIALSHPLEPLPSEAETQNITTALDQLVQHFGLGDYHQGLVKQVKDAFADPSQTLAAQLLTHIKDKSLADFALDKALAYHDYDWTAHYALKGYVEMELSTQMLLFDAIQKGIHFEILDEQDQFLKLWHKDHVEYVKNGNMTSKDNYVVPLAMANKTVTKKILADAGFPVPAGDEFTSLEQGLAYYPLIKDKQIVVKPKSTNFGLGISIFQEPTSLDNYKKSLEIAFAEDTAVLVEEFIPGTEYRFFILDGRCEAVLLRVAANVVGDGKHTIRELVAQKNANPLRGRDHRSPLEIIELGDIEQLMLTQQAYTPDDILPEGKKVNLRRNSNISTGGDSIDVTETMDSSYQELAAAMATSMGAWACGVDLIIPDETQTTSKENPHCTCIELNFNPSMYMHTYCAEGPGQAITPKILDKLFPEVATSQT
ncbi:bifunctional glutamate--cysteine ligase GshA/glutathione synthetase GshB [Streptococcus vestibularis]|uniref:bifunctional glutamate--cysteine ligase GshA/glutathione synthetase GshB n=1 Tax=Streptococcus vestibularis TaxID=1343 RepID=UPI0023315368|nr:bifunctional glutamate--cysteine ligase GshA/glutathione synthetase GshB [Streptococcus vestibularis]MDB6184812.1 bifunctional glutamate--cysteine ligase GshA/glutathione synthetase GshB [Streptococcus vestibularis]MDB6202099.1 bifunctional glutamate--cysteine ligase GshA/glutathione synthetase GshB [Streptococcus vestibularis]MDB6208224.1 bifunctional glutamate--cysteine ligase GshA/glutathione synthetase GshB [Streptococcus vestibularis]MDB6211631.1 bifunctional glutamate--cysteine ligase 